MKNTGQGETSTLEQAKVDEPVEITNRNDLNRLNNMFEGDKLKIIPVDTLLYKNTKGYWSPMTIKENSDTEIKLQKGDIVTYKGEYETFENAVTGEKIAYLKVVLDDGTEGYLKLSTVELVMDSDTTTVGNVNNENSKVTVTSRANVSDKIIGQEYEEYVVAIAAGRNNDDEKGITNEEKNLKEEELTIKVAEKVEEMLKEYTNIKVVQTGSTSKNPGGIKNAERVQKAKNANPNLCIQIYFGDGDTAGVETIYKEGDDISQQLAEILAKNLASSMGLTNLNSGADTDKCKDSDGNSASLNIIENAAVTGFPSVVAIGGNLNKDPDASVIANDGVEKYAQAIVNSIDEYFKADHSGRTAIENEKTTYKDSIETRIINMKYVSQDKLQEYIDNGDFENALRSYTMDEDRNLIIVSWSQKEDGSIELKNNSSMNLKTTLKNYVMPFEYLLYFYIDTDYEKFTEDLADEVMKSEIVIAVQDNVTTTNTIEITKQRTDATVDEYDEPLHETNRTDVTVENVSTSVNVTYVSTWCVKSYQENSYSKAVLEIGDEKEKIVNVPGKVTESNSNSSTAENAFGGGIAKYTIYETDSEGNSKAVEKTYKYTVYEQTLTETHTISNTYEKGEYKTEGRENVFVELYNEHDMMSKVRTSDYLFSIIENNEKTANLLDLTKYLIYKATNVPWGVLEFDFSEYDPNKFSKINSGVFGSDILLDFLKSWENPTVWYYQTDKIGYSGYVSKYITQDKTKYICFDDGLGTRNFGFGVCHYYSGHFNNQGVYASVGVDITQYFNIGSTLDVDIVDQVKLLIVKNNREYINSKLTSAGISLAENQLQALDAICYQWGPYGTIEDFISAYQRYGDTEELRQNFTHHGDKPFLSGDNGRAYEIKRANANWTLFHEGRYLTSDGGELNPANYTGASKEGWTTKGVSCPRYYQSDERWANNAYNYKSGGTIRSGGCGASALAMAVSGLTGQDITPDIIVNTLNQNNIDTVNNGAGSAKLIAGMYGLTYQHINRTDKTAIDNALDSGKVCIFSIVANGIYTGGGHFIMCYGREGDNYYVIESGRYYQTDTPYAFNKVFSPGNQGVFVLGK